MMKKYIILSIWLSSYTLAENQFYVGADIGRLSFDQKEFDSVGVSSFLLGYQFVNWSVDGSYNISKTDSDVFGGDQKIKMYHLYSTYRNKGNYYYKLKVGITNERYKLYDESGKLIFDDVHSGITRGLGVGYNIGSLSMALEYSWLGGSLEMFSGGIRYNFE